MLNNYAFLKVRNTLSRNEIKSVKNNVKNQNFNLLFLLL